MSQVPPHTSAEAPRRRPHRPDPAAAAHGGRKPSWLKVPLPGGEGFARLKGMTRELGLNTVCEEARCPNIGECWKGEHATLTLMVLGDECTRRCRFCAVKTVDRAAPPDPAEPQHVGRAVAELGTGYVVITSVDRDDLPDGGARHFRDVIDAIRRLSPSCAVEVLTPDFKGKPGAPDKVFEARPEVFAHNVETVPRLYRTARPGSKYADHARNNIELQTELREIFKSRGRVTD